MPPAAASAGRARSPRASTSARSTPSCASSDRAMIDGPRVRLRAWREADLAALTAWRNDAALQAQLLSRVRGSSEEQVRDWATRRAAGPESLLLGIASIVDDKALGYLQLVGMNDADQRADLGICLAPGHQGGG